MRQPISFNRHTGEPITEPVDHLKQSLEDLFTTPKGTRPFWYDYGAEIWRYLDQTLDEGEHLALTSHVAEIIQKWEPRLSLTRLTAHRLNHRLTLTIEGFFNNEPICFDQFTVDEKALSGSVAGKD